MFVTFAESLSLIEAFEISFLHLEVKLAFNALAMGLTKKVLI